MSSSSSFPIATTNSSSSSSSSSSSVSTVGAPNSPSLSGSGAGTTASQSSSLSLSRAHGLLLGLAAGDRNGGPIQMALRLAASVSEHGTYEPADVFMSYRAWWAADGDDADDTGPTAEKVFEATKHLPRPTQCKHTQEHTQDEKHADSTGTTRIATCTLLSSIESCSSAVDRAMLGQTAGVNAVHRVAPLAIASCIGDDTLASVARQESRITHWHSISQHSCAAFVKLCRLLCRGITWNVALQEVLDHEEELCPDTPIICTQIRRALDPRTLMSDLRNDGFAPHVICAAVWFVDRSSCFEEALTRSLGYAGQSNYSPVLVGALCGARYGVEFINPKRVDHKHCRNGVTHKCVLFAKALVQGIQPE